MERLTLKSVEDTKRLADTLARHAPWGCEVGLSGDLGAGKTTFVRFLVGALGGSTSSVASPTFALQHEYQIPNQKVIEHWDLYRLRELPDELMEPPPGDTLRIVEWPEVAKGYTETMQLRLRFSLLEGEGRQVEVDGIGASALADSLRANS